MWTAAWEPGFTDGWHGWWPIGDVRAPQGAPVHAVSRSADKLDIFVTDIERSHPDGGLGAGVHATAGMAGGIEGGRAAPGAPVTAVSRSADKLDVFVVGTDGRVWTAAWEPSFPIGGTAGGRSASEATKWSHWMRRRELHTKPIDA